MRRREGTRCFVVYPRSIARPLALSRSWTMPSTAGGVYPALLLLAACLPFEIIRPVVVTPWLALTTEKLTLIVAATAWLLLGARALPSPREWRALLPSLSLLVVGLV